MEKRCLTATYGTRFLQVFIMPPTRKKVDIEAAFADGTVIDEAIAKGIREAVRRHKLLGQPIAVWRDNKVCWLQPDEIELPQEQPDENGAS